MQFFVCIFKGTKTIDCDPPYDKVNQPGTIIISPNYPKQYERNKDCQVTVKFAEGQRVAIKFDDFELVYSCTKDYLEVRDGATSNSTLIGSKLCGSKNPGVIESTGNSMTLRFHTNSRLERKGFKIRTYLGNIGLKRAIGNWLEIYKILLHDQVFRINTILDQ